MYKVVYCVVKNGKTGRITLCNMFPTYKDAVSWIMNQEDAPEQFPMCNPFENRYIVEWEGNDWYKVPTRTTRQLAADKRNAKYMSHVYRRIFR